MLLFCCEYFSPTSAVKMCVCSSRGDGPSEHEGGGRLHRETGGLPVRWGMKSSPHPAIPLVTCLILFVTWLCLLFFSQGAVGETPASSSPSLNIRLSVTFQRKLWPKSLLTSLSSLGVSAVIYSRHCLCLSFSAVHQKSFYSEHSRLHCCSAHCVHVLPMPFGSKPHSSKKWGLSF